MANWTGKPSDLFDPSSSDWIDALDRREPWRDILSRTSGFNDLHVGKWPLLYPEPSMLTGVSDKFKAMHRVPRNYVKSLKPGDIFRLPLVEEVNAFLLPSEATWPETVEVVYFEKLLRPHPDGREEHLLAPATPEDQKRIEVWEERNSSALLVED